MKVNDGKIHKEYKFFFYKRTGYFKKDCPKKKVWFEKKGTYYVLVCFESNRIEVLIIPGGYIMILLLMCLMLYKDFFHPTHK